MKSNKWYTNPEMIVALSALLIGIVTAFTSVYSAYVDREYARASVWPRNSKLEVSEISAPSRSSREFSPSLTEPAILSLSPSRN